MAIKSFICNMLCNKWTGMALGIFGDSLPDIRWHGFRFIVTYDGISDRNRAMIFWGFYESAEIRLIEKYFDGKTDVIELGSSLGIVSTHIAKKLVAGKKMICVEANSKLIDTIRANVSRSKFPDLHVAILNYAINYDSPRVYMDLSEDNTETRILKNKPLKNLHRVIETETISLSAICSKNNVHDFTLVCDIEGSEIDLLLCDAKGLQSCRQIFIELHSTAYKGKEYSPKMMEELLQLQYGFDLVCRDGNVYHFKKQYFD